MYVWARRFLVLIALMFWQGGFTFYAAVVVPLGQATFGPLEQGLLTRQVTNYLNLAGLVAVAVCFAELWLARDASRGCRRCRWALLAINPVLLILLVHLHGRLDSLVDIESGSVLDRNAFRYAHRMYLWMSTVQWVCCVLFAGLTLLSWRREDRYCGI